MAENEKATPVPRIGEMIESATGVKYESYSADQKLGQTAEKPYVNLEAAVAAIVNHPDIKDKVYDRLQEQASVRHNAVMKDMSEELGGIKLDGLKPVQMVDGKVKSTTVKDGKVVNGGLFMSEAPTEADVRASDKATPGKLESDLAKLAVARQVLKDPKWLAAEGESNLTNAMRDAEIDINGKSLTDGQKKAIEQGIKAEANLLERMETNKPMMFFREARTHRLEHKVDKLMDAAATAAGIKLDDPAYQHYKEGMQKGIDAGIEAAKQLHDHGVAPTKTETALATTAAAPKKEAALGKTS